MPCLKRAIRHGAGHVFFECVLEGITLYIAVHPLVQRLWKNRSWDIPIRILEREALAIYVANSMACLWESECLPPRAEIGMGSNRQLFEDGFPVAMRANHNTFGLVKHFSRVLLKYQVEILLDPSSLQFRYSLWSWNFENDFRPHAVARGTVIVMFSMYGIWMTDTLLRSMKN